VLGQTDDEWSSGEEDDRFDVPEMANSLFQEPELFVSDEEILEKMRESRQTTNDMWQFLLFAEMAGDWEGLTQEYRLSSTSGELELVEEEETSSSLRVEGGTDPSSSRLIFRNLFGANQVEELSPTDCRPQKGKQIVGTAFTLCTCPTSSSERRPDGPEERPPQSHLCEVGIRSKDNKKRIRVILDYEQKEEESGPSWELRSLKVVREVRVRSANETEASRTFNRMDTDLFWTQPGKGIYDLPPVSSQPEYRTLSVMGRLTVCLPLKVGVSWEKQLRQGATDQVPFREGGTKVVGAISVDWTIGKMRYQADRKFDRLDGSISSLEETEILGEDADVYVPPLDERGQ